MRLLRTLSFTWLVLAAVALLPQAAAAQGGADDPKYALTKGCFTLTRDGQAVQGGERFRAQATALGRYLLLGRDGRYLAAGPGGTLTTQAQPSPAADFALTTVDGGFRLGDLPGTFAFTPAEGCATFPEAEVNATGEPSKGATPFGEVRGLLDAHLHMMAFEFIGGSVRCGRPWHPYGITFAMVDCPDHQGQGAGAALENVLSRGAPVGTHDPVGWPTFKDWPAYRSLTHEQVYFKGLERAWRGGLRMVTNLLVDNAALCDIYPLKRNSCDEMESIRLQARRTRELQDYVDAQEGGPGKGWLRIVSDPFEARRVVNQGKLAVVLGIETSKLFNCGVYNDQPECSREDVDRQLDEVVAMGVRQMELVNKFDNAFAGVAGDAGTTGVAVNAANKYETGQFWAMQTCTEDDHAGHSHGEVQDRTQLTPDAQDRAPLAGGIAQLALPPGAIPLYPAAPHCNQRGLTALGEHLVRRMVQKGIIVDPDHLSVRARKQVMSILEAERYSGVISSHTWSTPDVYPRIYRLGGTITPYAGDSTKFVQEWRKTKPMRDGRFFFGFGYGADTNGFGAQGAPRGKDVPNGVRYPFRSFDGAVTFDRQRVGERVYDLNADGVAHYGLYPDWIEDLRMLAGDEIVADMARGPEAYLQMWERAAGVPMTRCVPSRRRFDRGGLGAVRLGLTPEALLRSAGQPGERPGRRWRFCVQGPRDGRAAGSVTPVLTPEGAVALVASTGSEHPALGVRRGDRASKLRGARRFGPGLRIRSAGGGARYVFGVRRGRVRFVAVAGRAAGTTPGALRETLRLAGL